LSKGSRRHRSNAPVSTPPQPESPPMPKLLIGIPTERTVMVEAMNGIVGLAMRAGRYGWPIVDFQYMRADSNRDRMVWWLLESKQDWLLMLDSDHKHDPTIAERFAWVVSQEPDIRILSGLNYRRGTMFEPMAYLLTDPDDITSPLTAISPEYISKEGLLRVDAVSTAALMVHREVFEAMEPPWFVYDYSKYRRGVSASEDIVWCRRVMRETTYKIYVQTQITSPHLYVDTIADGSRFEQWLAAQKERDGSEKT
jgi:hypothetical protein